MKYFKRQIKLNKLGIDIDENIKNMINLFNKTVPEYLKRVKHKSGYVYKTKGNIDLLYYDTVLETFRISHIIWSKFYSNFNLNHKEINEKLNMLLEDRFKVKSKEYYLQYIDTIGNLI